MVIKLLYYYEIRDMHKYKNLFLMGYIMEEAKTKRGEKDEEV